MASTQKQSGGSQEPPMFLDILTKEEKEALLNKKMEEIRRKNEALRKRHEEIEADKKAAQQMGRLVDPRTQVSITPNKKPEVTRDQQREVYRNMRGVREDRGDDKRTGKLATGRAKRLSNMSKEKLKAQEFEKVAGPPSLGTPPGQNPGFNRRRGGGGGTGRVGGQQDPTSPDSENGPPPDPAFNFLSDRSREGPLPEKFREQKSTARHPRNFGGTNFSNVQQRIKDVDLKGRHGGPPRSKMEMAMKMTGRERREYSEWKNEREMIDQARIDRQLSNSGDWKREWDHDKIEQDFESDPAEGGDSRRTEPGRRPDSSSEDLSVIKSKKRKPRRKKTAEEAGRIGSGRFDRGDSLEERKRGDGPGITEQALENLADYERDSRDYERDSRDYERDSRGYERDSRDYEKDSRDYERDSRGGYRNQGRGRGGRSTSRGRGAARPTSGNFDRHRASSTGSDETSRSVEEQNDSLIVKIDNEFANSGRRFKGSFEANRSKRRSYDGDRMSNDSWEENRKYNEEKRRSLDSDVDWRSQQDREVRGHPQENGEQLRGGGGKRPRGEKARRSLYRGGDDGVRSDGIREPPHAPKVRGAVRRGRYTTAGSGRIPEQNIREGDSNLADVEPHVAMGTFDENWDYGDLQPGQIVQIVSADLSDGTPATADLADMGQIGANNEDVILSPEDEEEWEDAHDFYNTKDGDDEDEEDIHNSSAESLERFIQEHTLKLDVNVESMVPPLSPLSDQASPDDSSVVKHPLNAAKMLDWGASEILSDNASGSHSHNTSLNAEEMAEHLPEAAPEKAEDPPQAPNLADGKNTDNTTEHESSKNSTEDPLQEKKDEEEKEAKDTGEDGAKDSDMNSINHTSGTAAEGIEIKAEDASGDHDTTIATTAAGEATETQAEKPITEPTQSPGNDDSKPSADTSSNSNQAISSSTPCDVSDSLTSVEASCDDIKELSVVAEPVKEEEDADNKCSTAESSSGEPKSELVNVDLKVPHTTAQVCNTPGEAVKSDEAEKGTDNLLSNEEKPTQASHETGAGELQQESSSSAMNEGTTALVEG